MNPMLAMVIFQAAKMIVDPGTRVQMNSVKDAVDALLERSQKFLPKKEDGTDWTRADVLALADQTDAHFQEIKDLMGD